MRRPARSAQSRRHCVDVRDGGRWRQLRRQGSSRGFVGGDAPAGALEFAVAASRAEAHRARRLQPRQASGKSRRPAPHMIPSFRWFGAADPIPLAHIRSDPRSHGHRGAALYDVPVGDAWSRARASAHSRLRSRMPGFALPWSRASRCTRTSSWGAPGADRLIDNYWRQHREYGRAPHSRVVLQLHAVFDWTRTDLAMRLPDGPRRSRTTIGRSPPSICRAEPESSRGGPPRTSPRISWRCSPPTATWTRSTSGTTSRTSSSASYRSPGKAGVRHRDPSR